jgi:energy-coupling factor transport system ATP-binding protein
MMSEMIIEIKDLFFSYEENDEVLKNISLSIKRGSYTAILGHNGSGKSTLAKLIIGLLPSQSGEIIVDGLILNEENLREIRSKIGVVFQNPDNQFIGATVRDDIAFGLENRCVPQIKMDDIINEYAKKVGMEDYLDKEPTLLSGGQKQRVAIAGVLAMTPKIVILDEATSMLDPKGKKEIIELTRKMRELYPELTVISITHDVDEALGADEIIVLNQGEIYYQGNSNDIFLQEEKLIAIDLDIPFVYKLRNELAKHEIEVSNCNSEEMLVNELCQ